MIHLRKPPKIHESAAARLRRPASPSLWAADFPTMSVSPATASNMTADEVNDRILAALPGARVQVRSEDNVHFEALVVAPQFDGLRTIKRHQLVYAALGAAVGGEIHALSLDTPTPDEWAARGRG